MAPAAMSTLITHFEDTNTTPDDYDLIVTGDLGKLGCEILLDEVDKTILKCPWGSWAPGKFDIYVFEERGYIKATKKRYSSIEEYEKMAHTA